MFPETIYRWQQGANRYTVTVVDYSNSEAIYMANPHSEAFNYQCTGRSIFWDRSSTPRRSVIGDLRLFDDGRVAIDNIGPSAGTDIWVIDAHGIPNKLTAD